MGISLPAPTFPEEQGQSAAASAADSAVTVPGRRDLQHRRTEQGRRQHLPQEGGGAVATASLKDTARTMSPCYLWPPGWATHPHSWNHHAQQDSWLAPSSRLCSWQREDAGPWEAAGLEPWGPAVAGSGDRLRLPHAGRRAPQHCPGRQGLKSLFIAAAQLGPAASNHLLPLYSWPLVQLLRGGSTTGQVRLLAAPGLEPTGSGWQPACLPPALCLQRPACGSDPHPPRSVPVWGPPGKRLGPGGSLALELAPCLAGALGRARQPQPAGPGGWLSPRGVASQMAHNTASSSAAWSPPGPGRVGMLRATSIPCSSCCGSLAIPGTML